jgi:hypothetical protein
MNLIEDYLRAVAVLLPKDQRDDITAELRDTILSRIEAREAELGRRLNDAEVEAVLHEVGHPLVVAARYREGPQSIVGPTLYPFWVFAVRVAVTIQLCIAGVVFLVRTVTGADFTHALGQALASSITGAATLIGFITVAAWVIERRANKPDFINNWRVKDLKVLELAAWDLKDWGVYLGTPGPEAWSQAAHAKAHARGYARSYASSDAARDRRWRRLRRHERSQASRGLGVIVGAAVFALWWIGVLHFGFSATPDALRRIAIEPGPLASIDWAALKSQVFFPVLLYTLVSAAYGFAIMARPVSHTVHGAFDLALGGGLLAFTLWLATLSPLAAAVNGDNAAMLALRVKDALRAGLPYPLAEVLIVLMACMGLNGIVRLLRGMWLIVDPYPARFYGGARPAKAPPAAG